MNVISSLLPLIAAVLCVGCSGTSPYQAASNGASAEVTAEDCFAAALQEQMPGVLASNGVPGAVGSYIKNGEVAWTKAFGVANLQTGTPMREAASSNRWFSVTARSWSWSKLTSAFEFHARGTVVTRLSYEWLVSKTPVGGALKTSARTDCSDRVPVERSSLRRERRVARTTTSTDPMGSTRTLGLADSERSHRKNVSSPSSRND